MKRTTVSERGLVLAPRGRDGAIAVTLLEEAGIEALACASPPALIAELDCGAAFVVLTEEAISTADLNPLVEWIEDQEEWSDLPFILLTRGGGGLERNPAARRYLDLLGNVSFLERPFHPTTLVSLASSALRARRRQYEARARLVALRESETRYRTLFDAIESGFCVVEVDVDACEGRSDYRVVEANPAFYRQTGFPEEILGRWLREAAPALEEQWFETYVRVARTGAPERFEQGSEALGRWFDIYAFRIGDPAERRVAILFNDISVRRRAEVALQESEARFRNMADHAPVMMWVTDPSGYCTYLNRAWYEFTGQTQAEAEGFGWLEATHPGDKEEAERAFREANAARAPFRVEYRLRRAEGTYRWAIDAASPRFGDEGEYLGYVGSVIDIDERREIEERQRESEARLRTLTNALPAFVWFATPDGELHYFNDRWYEYTGQTPDQAVPDGWTAMVHPEDADHNAAMWADARARGVVYENELRYRRLDGEYRWYVARAEPLRDETGTVTGWFGTSTDIHDRKLAETALHELNDTLEQRVAERTLALGESERRFRGIFDSALQFMALLKPDGTVIEVNRTALSWSEIEPEEIVGRRFWLAAPMRGNPALQEAIEAGIRRAGEGETVREEHEMRGAGDVRATIDFSLKPVLDDRGDAVWLVAEGRDISELKEAQEALRQSQKLESMGQLTGGVAHDINNLLTPITGALDLLQRKGLGGEREWRLIDGALQSAERAKVLVQRLLAFARRQPLQPAAVDVGRVIEGMAELVESTTGPQIKFAVNIAGDLPPAYADANQLEMAVLNLAVNARDAMPDGGTLGISAELEVLDAPNPHDLPAGRYVRLSVADTGSGMDEATLKRAVEPFFSTKGIGKGTGLGLSMVHGLAAQLGGSLAIFSTPGLGTTIELRFPVANTALFAPKSEKVVESVRGAGTVLVVDDEELVRTSTADMLSDFGYTVVEANSAEEALQLVDRGLTPRILITDHLMPGMSGTELAREVSRRLPTVRALIISGYADVEGIAPDLLRLEKPFRRADLAERLARLATAD
ncbi:PAS domain S-box protein [Sphingosinithalassobacter sp. CS137]|uniref:PAS domain S-box protein n=1 Tax=Sphingosinithalassobacter sp. CS137 TaxID=2762748 RepID=UPI00165D6029|nr:PAS domain S-box protein [Sphingosinithalassobacter sp. CS137]